MICGRRAPYLSTNFLNVFEDQASEFMEGRKGMYEHFIIEINSIEKYFGRIIS